VPVEEANSKFEEEHPAIIFL